MRKIAAKSFATSTIGPHVKWCAWRTDCGVNRQDAHAIASSETSRTIPCNSRVVPAMSIEMPGFHTPESSTAARIASRNRKLILPSHANRAVRRGIPVRAAQLVLASPEPTRRRRRTAPAGCALARSVGHSIALVVQKKSTPLRNPRNSGGSPSGVNAPPMFATRKMKNITTCARCRRLSFARRSGRIRSIAAPVVPMMLASTVPRAQNAGVERAPSRAGCRGCGCRPTPCTTRAGG